MNACSGNPLQVEEVGETEIPIEVFNEYLRTHSQDRLVAWLSDTVEN